MFCTKKICCSLQSYSGTYSYRFGGRKHSGSPPSDFPACWSLTYSSSAACPLCPRQRHSGVIFGLSVQRIALYARGTTELKQRCLCFFGCSLCRLHLRRQLMHARGQRMVIITWERRRRDGIGFLRALARSGSDDPSLSRCGYDTSDIETGSRFAVIH